LGEHGVYDLSNAVKSRMINSMNS